MTAPTTTPTTTPTRGPLLRYGASIAAAATALLLRWAIDPFGGETAPFATLYAAVAFSVWFGGRRAAGVAAVLGYLGADYLFVRPSGTLSLFDDPSVFVAMLAYAASCSVIVALGRGMQTAKRRVELSEQELFAANRVATRRADEMQALFDAAPVAIWVAHDPDCAHVTGNRFANSLVGSTREWRVLQESGGSSIAYRLRRGGRDLPSVEQPLQRAARGESVTAEEYELLVDGRGAVLLTCDAAPLLDERGDIRGAIVVGTDVTERRQMERALQRSERAHRLLVELHDATRDLHDPNAVLWEIVQRVGRHFAVSRCTYAEIDEAEGHVMVARDYVDDVGSIAGRHRLHDFGPEVIRALRNGETAMVSDIHTDARTNAPDVAAAYAALETRSLLCVPLVRSGRFDALLVLHHRAPRGWTADDAWLLEQVAQRTWYAVQGARAEAALREGRDVLALAMRGGGMGAWSRDLATDEVWWSRELEEIFGLPPGGFEGTHDGFRDFVHPDDQPLLAAAVETAIRNDAEYAIEFRFRHASGEWRWMEGRGRSVRRAQDGRLMLYGLGIDITERRRVEDALKEADRRKDEFLALLAHELRNPLAPIRNATQFLRVRGQQDAELQGARAIIERQVQHLVRLVDDLLDVSRISRGKINLQRERVPLEAVIRGAIEASRPQIEAGRHALDVVLPPAPLVLDADVTRLSQVITNLLNNAAKYTPAGGRIVLHAHGDGDEAVIRVRDNGIGISAGILPTIFQMFTQGDQSLERSTGGLGIGLTLVDRLVQLHGGTVHARSDGPGRGSEFTVRLPLPPQLPLPAAPVADAAPLPAASPVRVLVVDDNVDSADSLSMMLRLIGYEAHTAYDGEAGADAARALRPSVILLDIGMPRKNGYDVARELRAEEWCRDALLIAISGWGQDEDRRRSREAGFDHHLVKPVDHTVLLSFLGTARPGGTG